MKDLLTHAEADWHMDQYYMSEALHDEMNAEAFNNLEDDDEMPDDSEIPYY